MNRVPACWHGGWSDCVGLEHVFDAVAQAAWLHEALRAPFASLRDFLAAGGWVLRWIIAVALFLWALVLERYWYLWRVYPAQQAARLAQWRARGERHSWTARCVREMLISELKVAMSAPLPLIRVVVPLAPLMGLLGTISGMLEVFDALQQHGDVDVRAMSAGVSHAMVATLAGLVVSLVGLLFYTQLGSRIARRTARLQDLFPVS